MREQTERLELRELAPHRRRRDGQRSPLDEVLRADGLARADVFLDDAPEDLLLTWTERELHRFAAILPCGQDGDQPRAGAVASGDEIGGHGAADEAPALGERQPFVAALREPEPLEARQRLGVDRGLESLEAEALVQPQPEHHPLAQARRIVDLLDLTR